MHIHWKSNVFVINGLFASREWFGDFKIVGARKGSPILVLGKDNNDAETRITLSRDVAISFYASAKLTL
jgi:hypothetical protein